MEAPKELGESFGVAALSTSVQLDESRVTPSKKKAEGGLMATTQRRTVHRQPPLLDRISLERSEPSS